MNMDMTMESPDPGIAELPLSDPRCVAAAESCVAFYAAENASQAALPFERQFQYGHWLTYYYVAILCICALTHGLTLLRDHYPSRRSTASAAATTTTTALRRVRHRLRAGWRWVSYRQLRSGALLDAQGQPLGMLALLLVTVIFVAALVFAVRPYYRDHLGYGSPPLAIRCGIMAYACTPILVALAGKANVVSAISGIGHERLNFIHRWVSWLTLALSLAHTIPFFIQSEWDGGLSNVVVQFYMHGLEAKNEYSGVPPLAILFGLCVFSLPPIRERVYKLFWGFHLLLAITYIGLLFWHAQDEQDSWAYLWATIALWVGSMLVRAFWFVRPFNIHSEWLKGAPMTLSPLTSSATRIDIRAPASFTFAPGQHCFLRIPELSAIHNHPFTIVTAPSLPAKNESYPDSAGEDVQLTFFARAHAGFTREISRISSNSGNKTYLAWIDGPYGGVGRPLERLFDTIVLVAGGSGITACLSWLLHLHQCHSNEYLPRPRTTRVILVWAIKKHNVFDWVEDMLQHPLKNKPEGLEIEIRLYVTDDRLPDNSEKTRRNVTWSLGRPDLKEVIERSANGGDLLVFCCGPQSLRRDLGNMTAALQGLVFNGKLNQLALYQEVFGW